MPTDIHGETGDPLLDHLDGVYRFALRLARSDPHLAEDLVQETILRALKSDRSCHDHEAVRTWLFTVLRNVLRDRLRHEAVRRRVTSDQAVEQVPSKTISAEHAAILSEEVTMRLSDLDRLPERQRSVLYLSACEELSHDQIARVLGISTQAVKASLSVARQQIRRRSSSPGLKRVESRRGNPNVHVTQSTSKPSE